MQENSTLQNIEPFKREPVLSAFFSVEALAAIVSMILFWMTIGSFEANISNTQRGDLDNDIDLVEQAKKLAPMQLAMSGKIDEAVTAASLELNKRKHDPLTLICTGDVFMLAGLKGEGLRYLKKAVALSHRNKFVMLDYAQSLANAGQPM